MKRSLREACTTSWIDVPGPQRQIDLPLAAPHRALRNRTQFLSQKVKSNRVSLHVRICGEIVVLPWRVNSSPVFRSSKPAGAGERYQCGRSEGTDESGSNSGNHGNTMKWSNNPLERSMNQPTFLNRRNLMRAAGSVAVSLMAPPRLLQRSALAVGKDRDKIHPTSFPLQISGSRRYLMDQHNAPFLIAGDAPQAMVVKLSVQQASHYFTNRLAYGFNSMWINLLCAGPYFPSCNKDGSTLDGIRPFMGYLAGGTDLANYDLTRPNEAYFARADHMLGIAAKMGLLVFLDPIETGQWLKTLQNNGPEKCLKYGKFLGQRYGHFKNIIWLNGNDFGSWAKHRNDRVVQAVAEGVHAADPTTIQTVELLCTPSLQDPAWTNLISLNGAYTYGATYQQMLQNYNHQPPMPTFLLEAHYEMENVGLPPDYGTPAVLRRQAYWTMLCGGCGQIYGNHYIWGFFPEWQSHLNTPGAAQFKIWKYFFNSIPWYALIPDQSHDVVIAGLGTYGNTNTRVSQDDYCTAACTADRTLVVAYLPTPRSLEVNMAKLSRPVHASWFDPTNGTYTAISRLPLVNRGKMRFSPARKNHAGSSDWVLVLNTQQD